MRVRSLPAWGLTMPRPYHLASCASASTCGIMSVVAARLALLTAPAAHPASLVSSCSRRPPPVFRWLVFFPERADRCAGSFQLLPGSRVGLEPTRRDSPLTSRHADSQEEPQGGLQVPVPGCVCPFPSSSPATPPPPLGHSALRPSRLMRGRHHDCLLSYDRSKHGSALASSRSARKLTQRTQNHAPHRCNVQQLSA